EELRNVFLPRLELAAKPALAGLPAVRVHGRLEVHQVTLPGVKRHDVQLGFVPAPGALSHRHVAPHEVAAVLVPLGDELFEEVVCHSNSGTGDYRLETSGFESFFASPQSLVSGLKGRGTASPD